MTPADFASERRDAQEAAERDGEDTGCGHHYQTNKRGTGTCACCGDEVTP